MPISRYLDRTPRHAQGNYCHVTAHIIGDVWLGIGRPVQKMRAMTQAELVYLRYSAEHYVRVKNNYLAYMPRSFT